MDYKAFGKYVKEQRMLRDLSQEDLAREIGVTHKTIVNIESGKNCYPSTRRKIRAAFENIPIPEMAGVS